MLSKKFMAVALVAAATATSSVYASDRGFNTVAGAVVGAAVGNSISSGDRHRGYRDGRYVETRVYSQPAPVYYEPAPVYYAPPPRYYAPPPRVVYVEPARPYYRESRRDYYYGDRWDRGHHHHDRYDR